MSGNLDIKEPASDGTPVRPEVSHAPDANGTNALGPRVVHRDGMAYIEGCYVPVWQLERAHRAGSSRAAMLRALPMLTAEGLDLAFAYARQHSEEIDALIKELGPTDVPPEEEEDDEEDYQADLDEMFERYGEVFRRLAQ